MSLIHKAKKPSLKDKIAEKAKAEATPDTSETLVPENDQQKVEPNKKGCPTKKVKKDNEQDE